MIDVLNYCKTKIILKIYFKNNNNNQLTNMPRTSACGLLWSQFATYLRLAWPLQMYRYMFDTPSPAEEELDDVAFLAYLDANRSRYHHRGPYKKHEMKEWEAILAEDRDFSENDFLLFFSIST